MTITLDLQPEIGARLAAQADACGVSLNQYLKTIVESEVRIPEERGLAQSKSHDEWESEFEAFVDSFPQAPVLSDAALSRENMYTREDDL